MEDKNVKTITVIAIFTSVVASASAIITYQQGFHARQRVDELQTEVLELNTELATRSAGLLAPSVLPPPPPSPPEPKTITHDMQQSADERDAEVERLQSRIAELEAEANERKERRRSMRESMEKRMEKMKAENPEEYERRRKEGQERLQKASAMTSERLELMKSIPIDGLSPEYLKNHLVVLERLEFFDTTMAQLAENPDRDNMRELMPQIFMNMHGLDEMLEMEREVMLNDLARDLGYEGQQTGDFVAAVNSITEATTMPSARSFMNTGHSRRNRPE